MKRYLQRYRDDSFALTTLQNPNLEVRTYAQPVQTAQQEREWQPTSLRIPATHAPATPRFLLPARRGLPADQAGGRPDPNR